MLTKLKYKALKPFARTKRLTKRRIKLWNGQTEGENTYFYSLTSSPGELIELTFVSKERVDHISNSNPSLMSFTREVPVPTGYNLYTHSITCKSHDRCSTGVAVFTVNHKAKVVIYVEKKKKISRFRLTKRHASPSDPEYDFTSYYNVNVNELIPDNK